MAKNLAMAVWPGWRVARVMITLLPNCWQEETFVELLQKLNLNCGGKLSMICARDTASGPLFITVISYWI